MADREKTLERSRLDVDPLEIVSRDTEEKTDGLTQTVSFRRTHVWAARPMSQAS